MTPLDLDAAARPVLAMLDAPDFAPAVAARAGADATRVARAVADIASEARLALRLLTGAGVVRGQRVLEVGAGAGVVAGVLHRAGADVAALDPLIDGFDLFPAVKAELVARDPAAAIALDRRSAHELDPACDGPFALIYSVNVLEHVHPLDAALDAMGAVLAPGGRMLHTCPNYRVPYEPHFAMPLVPLVPAWTAWLHRGLAGEPIWESLNFITPADLRRFARRSGLRLTLEPGVLANTVERLGADPAFAHRHALVGRVLARLASAGALGWLRALPAAWVTPMVFVLERPV